MRPLSSLVATFAAIGILSASSVVLAEVNAAKPAVSVNLSAYEISMNKKGESIVKPVDQVKPNDIIEYRATYTNNTSKTINGLVATLPIPADTKFLAKSSPAKAQASTDGINFAAMPLKRKVGTQMVNVPLQEYRALRWTVAELPAGKSITVTAQTRVNGTTSAADQ